MKRKYIYLLLIIIILLLLYIIYSKKKEGFLVKYYRPHARRLRKFVSDYIFRYIK
jgi:hypothetical protein